MGDIGGFGVSSVRANGFGSSGSTLSLPPAYPSVCRFEGGELLIWVFEVNRAGAVLTRVAGDAL